MKPHIPSLLVDFVGVMLDDFTSGNDPDGSIRKKMEWQLERKFTTMADEKAAADKPNRATASDRARKSQGKGKGKGKGKSSKKLAKKRTAASQDEEEDEVDEIYGGGDTEQG